jgi:hypothetical protein
MKKKTTNESWDVEVNDEPAQVTVEDTVTAVAPTRLAKPSKIPVVEYENSFDMEGLMTDFPTAKDLEKFVYDRTGVVLNLKGRANKLKYQIAMDTLNGGVPGGEFLGSENPYLDKNELVPTETLRVLPPRDAVIDAAGPEVTRFVSNAFPHPDAEWKAQDMKCQVIFRKYANGIITYEVLGPIALRAVGTRMNKYGQHQPERYIWVDPRTGEQIIRNENGTLSAIGTRLRGFMKRQRVNNSNQWDVWIDREFVVLSDGISDNPWSV